jgi:hypothetical protein
VEKYIQATQATDDHMAYAHYMLERKVTHMYSEYLIHVAFPLQQWLNEGYSMLRYTYKAYLVEVY